MNPSVIQYHPMIWSPPSAYHVIHLNWISPHTRHAGLLFKLHLPLRSFFPIVSQISACSSEFVFFYQFFLYPLISYNSYLLWNLYITLSLVWHLQHLCHTTITFMPLLSPLSDCRTLLVTESYVKLINSRH